MRKIIFFVIIVIVNSISWQSCVYETIPGPVNCDVNPVVLELVSVEDSNCALIDGRLEVRASGGGGNYRFMLGNNDEQLVSVFQDLAAGVYEISVADKNNCSATLEVVVKNKNGLNITFATTEAGCNTSNGSITVSPIDGTVPYNFKIDNSNFTIDNTFTDLPAGKYMIVVSDAAGCEISQTIKVKTGVSFSASISEIIKNNCAVGRCHNGSQFPDFRVFKNIHDNASQIKLLTGNRTMPLTGSLTQVQINAIACWVDDGAPDN